MQSKPSVLRKKFETENEFSSSTQIRLKRLNESSFQGAKITRKAISGKYTESVIIVLKGARLIIQESVDQRQSHGRQSDCLICKNKKALAL